MEFPACANRPSGAGAHARADAFDEAARGALSSERDHFHQKALR